MKIKTRHFGEVEIPEDGIIELPAGIPGFPTCKRFAILERSEASNFRWLICLDDPMPTFLVVDPLLVVEDYPVETIRREMRHMGIPLGENEQLAVAAIVSVPAEPESPTVNLFAPIAIGADCKKGAQVILHDSDYATREPLRVEQ